jgi:RHH-type proline utilization regulon transcriptional repressor/proline dehydrogenase/delta 1-pyrroline-5-carboxylate dehydrogenase
MIDARVNAMVADDVALRAALFRFVDVMPACKSDEEVVEHLLAYLATVPELPLLLKVGNRLGATALGRPVVATFAQVAVRHLARRFIAGERAEDAATALEALWLAGISSSVDLLGEATVTEDEADAYGARCARTLEVLAARARRFPPRPLLEADGQGAIARVNLSVKISALTARLRPEDPELGIVDALERLRVLLRLAARLGAHLHVDMESLDTREAILTLVLRVLREEEFAQGPSVGLVLQAYLRDAAPELDQILEFARSSPRTSPLVVRLVKGAYWDHEVTEARQHGWSEPVFTDKADSDASFELLTRRLLEARPAVRVAIASHNLRSIAHALAYSRQLGAADSEVELQVLRGLGDDLGVALSSLGLRVRVYSPVGDLVAGMAYLVRRLLENTSNESFLRARARGVPLDELLAAP